MDDDNGAFLQPWRTDKSGQRATSVGGQVAVQAVGSGAMALHP